MMTRWIQRYRARGRYFAADRAAGDALAALSTAVDARDRMTALYGMAEQARLMAQNAEAFHAARDRDGFTLADSCEREAWLAAMLAATEAALICGNRMHRRSQSALSTGDLGAVLAQLRAEPRPARRGVLVLALHAAVIDRAGVQAAEVLPAIATAYFELSGMSYPDAVHRAWSGIRINRDGGAR